MASPPLSNSPATPAPDAVDLTNDTSTQPKDHMSIVAAMVRRESNQPSIPHPHRKAKRKAPPHPDTTSLPILTPPRQHPSQSPTTDSKTVPLSPNQPAQPDFIEVSDNSSDDVQIASVHKRKRPSKVAKKEPVFHRFLDLPPEIRNKVYEFLLTTPGIPIEFPRLTGPEGRRREAAWKE